MNAIVSFVTRLAVVLLVGIGFLDYPRVLLTVIGLLLLYSYWIARHVTVEDLKGVLDELERKEKENSKKQV